MLNYITNIQEGQAKRVYGVFRNNKLLIFGENRELDVRHGL
jgi:hypothetical protein